MTIQISVGHKVDAEVARVWQIWISPSDIKLWSSVGPSWHCPVSENDVSVNGKLRNRMEAKDGSFGFDFEGICDKVGFCKELLHSMSDGIRLAILFVEIKSKNNTHSHF
ncbi:SRPBCC domain-containing protein [Sphingobacterium sp. ML3W]|uniref:SRPBCC domain-containing protein n=1 Tax=Sphingobacterium sp. ML3W TaxID=1538644 RepID=UPI0009DE5BA0|nr:SRPBCC domain-containing protein [Sphingobacterium sp. ML3W]